MVRKQIAIAAVLLLAWAAAARAQDLTGVLTLQQGIVKLRHAGAETVHRTPGERVPVVKDDVIQSGPETRAKVSFKDEKEVVDIYPESHFKVELVRAESSSFRLSFGKIMFAVRTVLKPGGFQVKTPTATIGVKGTEAIVGTDGEKSFLLTLTGVVSLASNAFPDVEVLVGKDQVSVVKKDQPPTPPATVTPETRDKIQKEGGLTTMGAAAPAPPSTSDSKAPSTPPVAAVMSAVQETQNSVKDTVNTAAAAAAPPAGCTTCGTVQPKW